MKIKYDWLFCHSFSFPWIMALIKWGSKGPPRVWFGLAFTKRNSENSKWSSKFHFIKVYGNVVSHFIRYFPFFLCFFLSPAKSCKYFSLPYLISCVNSQTYRCVRAARHNTFQRVGKVQGWREEASEESLASSVLSGLEAVWECRRRECERKMPLAHVRMCKAWEKVENLRQLKILIGNGVP